MTNKIYASKIHLIAFSLVVFLSSCEDFLNVGNPQTQLVTSTVFDSDLTATAAMANIYTKLSSGSGGLTSITYLGPLLSDEATLFSTDQATQEFSLNNITAANSLASGFWGSSGYSIIYQTNAIIEGLQNSNKITPSIKKELMGEALFVRAFLHFYLVNLFGDVPYIATTDYRSNTKAARIAVIDVDQLMISDLQQAKTLLAGDYSFGSGEKVVPNKWAASALLSRVYLYSGDYAKAESEASLVIGQSFQLNNLSDVFLKNSTEAIWQLKPVISNRNTNEGSIFILTGQPKQSALQNGFVNAFESGDLRKSQWLNSVTANGSTWYYPYKYKVRTGSSLTEYSMVLRLAEQYLIRAEARANQNNLSESISDVDVIRQRAGLPLIQNTNPSITKDNLLLAIEQERRSELFSEWGHRWFDLKRTGHADAVLAPLKPGWQSTDNLLPVPASELLVDTNLIQNPGY